MPAADAPYLRVAADLRRRIREGDLPPGSPFPSRRALRRHYGVGDTPAGKATALLRADGLVAGAQRNRLVVTHPPAVRTMTDPTAPWPDSAAGERWDDETPATDDISRRLGIVVGEIVRVRTTEYLDLDARPSHLRILHTPLDDRPEAATHASEVWMRAAASGEAGLLGVAIGSPLLMVSIDWRDVSGRAVAAEDLVLPGDRWRVRLT